MFKLKVEFPVSLEKEDGTVIEGKVSFNNLSLAQQKEITTLSNEMNKKADEVQKYQEEIEKLGLDAVLSKIKDKDIRTIIEIEDCIKNGREYDIKKYQSLIDKIVVNTQLEIFKRRISGDIADKVIEYVKEYNNIDDVEMYLEKLSRDAKLGKLKG